MQMSKPKGRLAKRMAFYALQRRKAQGRAFIMQLRAALPAKAGQQPVAHPPPCIGMSGRSQPSMPFVLAHVTDRKSGHGNFAG